MQSILKTAVFASVVGAWLWFSLPTFMGQLRVPDVATFLQSEAIQELVTEKLATQVVIERDYGSVLWGTDHFLAYGVVELLIGVNLEELKVEKVGQNYVIDVPSPKIFHSSLDENSIKITRDATIFMRLGDLDAPEKQRDIRLQLLAAGERFAVERNLIPTRETIIVRIRQTMIASGIPTEHILFSVAGS